MVLTPLLVVNRGFVPECGVLLSVLRAFLFASYVYLALKSFQNFVIGKKVKIFSHNQNFVRIVHAGSSVTHLQQIAVKIFRFSMTKQRVFSGPMNSQS